MKLKINKVSELKQVCQDSRWLIDGLWLSEGIGMLAAQPKTGKSWLGLDMAVSIASGKPCLDQFEVKTPKKVLFFNAEDTQAIQRDRFENIKKAKGIDIELPNLGVITSEDGLRLDTEEGIQSLRKIVSEFKPDLLILDPFIRMHEISESDTTAVAKVLKGLRKLKDDFGTGVMLVHHATKGSKNIRGSTEFPAWGETNLFMYKDKTEKLFLDIQHRASESNNGVPLKISELKGGICLHVLKENVSDQDVSKRDSENSLTQNESPHKSSIRDFSSLSKTIMSLITSKFRAVDFNELKFQTQANEKELRFEIYNLIKQKQIRFTKQGYLKN